MKKPSKMSIDLEVKFLRNELRKNPDAITSKMVESEHGVDADFRWKQGKVVSDSTMPRIQALCRLADRENFTDYLERMIDDHDESLNHYQYLLETHKSLTAEG